MYLLPRAQPAQRMERGEGREANWLSHPLRREREREKETAGRQDRDGRKDTAMLRGCVYGGSDDRRDSLLHKTWISEALKVCFGTSGGP